MILLTMMLQCFTKKSFRAFLDAKSLRTILKSILSNISFSIQHVVKLFNLSCNIESFSSLNLEKLLLAEIRHATKTLG
jgi:hypothetical protein